MRKIWKTAVKIGGGIGYVMVPKGAQALQCAAQHGHLSIWWRVDPNQPQERRLISVIGTGHAVPDDLTYVGTALFEGDNLVLHVFVAPET